MSARRRQRAGTAQPRERKALRQNTGLPRSPVIGAWLVILVVSLAVYGRSLGHILTNWDDNVNISDHPFLSPFSFGNLWMNWSHPYARLYIPLVYTSWMGDMAMGGGAPWPHFLNNILLHAATAIVVFHLVLRVALPSPVGTLRWPGNIAIALVAALLFVVHPLQVEPVVWATARKDVLSGLLAVLALLFHLRSGDRGFAPGLRMRSPWFWAGFACFCLALLAKPAAVAVPVAAFCLDFFACRVPLRDAAIVSLPGVVVSAGFSLLTAGVQEIPFYFEKAYTGAWTRPFVAGDAIAFYAAKLVLPVGLVANYGRTPALAMANPWVYAWLPLAIAAFAFVMRRRTIWAASAGVALAFLLPVLGLVPFAFQGKSTVADRYFYLSMLGVALAVAAGLRLAMDRWPRRRGAIVSAAAVLLLVLAAASYRQAGFWKNSETLWRRASELKPEVVSNWTNLSSAMLRLKRYEDTLAATDRAISLDPESFTAFTNRGVALFQTRRAEEGTSSVRHAVELSRRDPLVQFTYGDMLSRMQRDAEAAAQFEDILSRHPDEGRAHLGLATALANLGRFPEAEREYKIALRIKPDIAAANSNLGFVLLKQNRPQEAARYLREALRLNPADAAAASELQRISPAPPANP